MNAEKIFKKEDGTRYKVTVSFNPDRIAEWGPWSVSVTVCQPGKRKFCDIFTESDHWKFQKLPWEQRCKYVNSLYKNYIPVEWIREVQHDYVKKIEDMIDKLEL